MERFLDLFRAFGADDDPEKTVSIRFSVGTCREFLDAADELQNTVMLASRALEDLSETNEKFRDALIEVNADYEKALERHAEKVAALKAELAECEDELAASRDADVEWIAQAVQNQYGRKYGNMVREFKDAKP
jgi:hypothetical protein